MTDGHTLHKVLAGW